MKVGHFSGTFWQFASIFCGLAIECYAQRAAFECVPAGSGQSLIGFSDSGDCGVQSAHLRELLATCGQSTPVLASCLELPGLSVPLLNASCLHSSATASFVNIALQEHQRWSNRAQLVSVQLACDVYTDALTVPSNVCEDVVMAISETVDDFVEGRFSFCEMTTATSSATSTQTTTATTNAPTEFPTTTPTNNPTLGPSVTPTDAPSAMPTSSPSEKPTTNPTSAPTPSTTSTTTSTTTPLRGRLQCARVVHGSSLALSPPSFVTAETLTMCQEQLLLLTRAVNECDPAGLLPHIMPSVRCTQLSGATNYALQVCTPHNATLSQHFIESLNYMMQSFLDHPWYAVQHPAYGTNVDHDHRHGGSGEFFCSQTAPYLQIREDSCDNDVDGLNDALTAFNDGSFRTCRWPEFITSSTISTRTVTTSITPSPTYSPSLIPTASPSDLPTTNPTYLPSVNPTYLPTHEPSPMPTYSPTLGPSVQPTMIPTDIPTHIPSWTPSVLPSLAPTQRPTMTPTAAPSTLPTATPSIVPSAIPTSVPSKYPTELPTAHPTVGCRDIEDPPDCYIAFSIFPQPSCRDLLSTGQPLGTQCPGHCSHAGFCSLAPTTPMPTTSPTSYPSAHPTSDPTSLPSWLPTRAPTAPHCFGRHDSENCAVQHEATVLHCTTLQQQRQCPAYCNRCDLTPTPHPTSMPTVVPSFYPTVSPTIHPTHEPSFGPTETPTARPSISPTPSPSTSTTVSHTSTLSSTYTTTSTSSTTDPHCCSNTCDPEMCTLLSCSDPGVPTQCPAKCGACPRIDIVDESGGPLTVSLGSNGAVLKINVSYYSNPLCCGSVCEPPVCARTCSDSDASMLCPATCNCPRRIFIILENVDHPGRGYIQNLQISESALPPITLPAVHENLGLDIQIGTWAPASNNYSLRAVLSPGSWRDRIADSSTIPVSLVEHTAVVELTAESQVIVKARGRSATLRVSLSYTSSLPRVNVILVIQNTALPNRGYITNVARTGTADSLLDMPAISHNVSIDVTLGSWTPTSSDFTISATLTPHSWADRIATSQPTVFSVVNEFVEIVHLPDALRKIRGRRGLLQIAISWFSTRGNVNVIAIVRDSRDPRRGFVRQVSIAPTGSAAVGLPPSGTAMPLELIIGSWATTGNSYTIEIYLTTDAWSQRFVTSGRQSFSILNEELTVAPIQNEILRNPRGETILPILVSYTAATNVTLVVVVKNQGDSRKYVREVRQSTGLPLSNLSSSGLVHVDVVLGGWASARDGYYLQVILTRGDWNTRFLTSPTQYFRITDISGAVLDEFSRETSESQNTMHDKSKGNNNVFLYLLYGAVAASTVLCGAAFYVSRRQYH